MCIKTKGNSLYIISLYLRYVKPNPHLFKID